MNAVLSQHRNLKRINDAEEQADKSKVCEKDYNLWKMLQTYLNGQIEIMGYAAQFLDDTMKQFEEEEEEGEAAEDVSDAEDLPEDEE